MFGISPSFYVNRQKRNMTWLGCICSIVMVGTISSLFFAYFYFFLTKSESAITTTKIHNEKYRLLDLKSKDQLIMMEHYPENPEINTILNLKAFAVSENKKIGLLEKREIPQVSCKEVTFQGKPISRERQCLEFHQPTEIGTD